MLKQTENSHKHAGINSKQNNQELFDTTTATKSQEWWETEKGNHKLTSPYSRSRNFKRYYVNKGVAEDRLKPYD